MNKKKQTFSFLRVIKAIVLFFATGILIVPLIMGIVNKNNYPEQYDKEVSEYEKEVKEIEECFKKVEELIQKANEVSEPIQLPLLDRTLKNSEVEEKTGLDQHDPDKLEERKMWKYDPDELKERKMGKVEAWRPMSRDCYVRKASLVEPRKNPPSIFYYYGKIIGYIIGSVVSMFFILLSLILVTLFEVHKLKNKNNIH